MATIGKQYSDVLMKIIFSIAPVLKSIDSELLQDIKTGSKWSAKEILGHLIDSAYNNHQRILRAGSENGLYFEGYDQDSWVLKNRYKDREASEILETFLVVQKHLAIMLTGLNNETLTEKHALTNLPEIMMNKERSSENATLSYLIWDYLFHLEHHLSQIIPGYINVTPAEYYI